MANITYPAGIATAYGAAVRGGYTGTYDDFCRQQAEYAESAAAVEQAKEYAEAAASAADTSKTAAAGSATEAATSAGQASTSATNAANSATEANTSKNAAATSATEAENSATSAAGSAATAQNVLNSIPPSYAVLADDVADLKSDFNNIVLNIPVAPVWVSGYINTNTGNIGADSESCSSNLIRSNGLTYSYTLASGYKVKVAEYNEDGSYIGLKVPFGSGDNIFKIDVGHLFRIQVTIDNGSLSPSDVTSSIFAIHYPAYTDTSLSISGKSADAKATGDIIHKGFTVSQNVFDQSQITEHAYISTTGLQTSEAYSSWFASDYIMVNGATKINSSIGLNSIIIYNIDGTVDAVNSYNGLNSSVNELSLPLSAYRIRVSAQMATLGEDIMINFGNQLLPYEPYNSVLLNGDALKENPKSTKTNYRTTTANYLSDCKQALKKNVVVSYYATFDTFTSLKIGFTKTDTYGTGYTDYFEITPTDFILHRSGLADITWQHELTIADYIGIKITFDFALNFTAELKTNGGTFSKSNYIYLGASYYPFAVISGTSVSNEKLAFSCKDLRKDVMMFGDSYFGNASSRWLYYMSSTERDNLCINGYAGESSASAIVDFETLVKLGSPKFIVWCLGMNDGSDADDLTPASSWLTNIKSVIRKCETNNIVPVLATIPSVPSINNRAKSAWVRNSGYGYIDFAKAVESDNNGNWYTGMLSSDNVHPTDEGAKALYSRAITDFPQLLVASN